VLYAALPNRLLIGPRYVVPGLELILFIPLVLANPRRMSKQNRLLRRLSIALLLLIAVSNLAALVLLIRSLVTGQAAAGGQLLGAAGQVWFTNVLVFALAFWEFDRGGPVTRIRVARPRLQAADFRFPQDEDHDAIAEVARRSSARSGWAPGFIDYFYVSVTKLLSVQSHRHHAFVGTREAAHGSRIGLSADSVRARRLLRRRPAQTLMRIGRPAGSGADGAHQGARRVGCVARTVVFVLVGVFVPKAAALSSASQAKGLNAVFRPVASPAGGAWLLALLASAWPATAFSAGSRLGTAT
jgi:hypothetical protein